MKVPGLEDHLGAKCKEWAKKHNPAHCTIAFHSAYVTDDGKVSVNFDISYEYSTLLRILLLPFYVMFTAVSYYDGVDWLEDVAYFKRFTRKGMDKKRGALEQTRLTFNKLLQTEAEKYLEEHKNEQKV